MIGIKSILKAFNFSPICEVSFMMIVEMFNCIGISSLKSFNEISSHSLNMIWNVNMRCYSEEECRDQSNCENVSVVNVFLESQMTLKEGEYVSIENEKEKEKEREEEMYKVRQILKLSGGGSGFSRMKSGDCLKIDDSVEIISETDFQSCSSFKEVIFSSNSHLREIDGFFGCKSLCRIEIPSSVEVIGRFGFFGCRSLKEISFSSESHLREIRGFYGCTSLCRIDIPSSVEVILDGAFLGCISLRLVIIGGGCRLRQRGRFQNKRIFIVYEDQNDMKEGRRLSHLSIGGRSMRNTH
jgi:hypothetical protein